MSVSLAVAATMALAAVWVSSVHHRSSSSVAAPPTPITLAPGGHLGADVKKVYAASTPRKATPGPIVVTVNPATGDVTAIGGRPARVEIDPSTDRLLSVTREPR